MLNDVLCKGQGSVVQSHIPTVKPPLWTLNPKRNSVASPETTPSQCIARLSSGKTRTAAGHCRTQNGMPQRRELVVVVHRAQFLQQVHQVVGETVIVIEHKYASHPVILSADRARRNLIYDLHWKTHGTFKTTHWWSHHTKGHQTWSSARNTSLGPFGSNIGPRQHHRRGVFALHAACCPRNQGQSAVGSSVDVYAARPRCPRHLVLLPRLRTWWSQQLVFVCWPHWCFGWLIYCHQISLVFYSLNWRNKIHVFKTVPRWRWVLIGCHHHS